MFSFTPRSLYPWRQHAMHLLSRGLAVTQSSSGRFGEDKFVACVGNRTTVHRLSDPGTIPTELSRLMFAFLNGNKNLMKTKRIIPPPFPPRIFVAWLTTWTKIRLYSDWSYSYSFKTENHKKMRFVAAYLIHNVTHFLFQNDRKRKFSVRQSV